MDIVRGLLGTLRIGLLVVLFLFVLAVVTAIGRPDTGAFETVVLGVAALGLLSLALPVHRVGRGRH